MPTEDIKANNLQAHRAEAVRVMPSVGTRLLWVIGHSED